MPRPCLSPGLYGRRLLLLKKSYLEELLRFYARQNARHCSRARAATTSRPGTSALQLPLRHCVLAPGKIRRCSHVCTAATSHLGTSVLQPPLRVASWRLAKCPALQPCVRRHHVMPGDIGAAAATAPLRLDSWQNHGTAAMCALLPHHARGHWDAAS